MLMLPFDFRIALPVRQTELLTISNEDWALVEQAGMQCVDLPGDLVTEAFGLREQYGKLTPEDCFSLVLAKQLQGSILLTGDKNLRVTAVRNHRIEVHGVLWVWDMLRESGLVEATQMLSALEYWHVSLNVRLPRVELESRMTLMLS